MMTLNIKIDLYQNQSWDLNMEPYLRLQFPYGRTLQNASFDNIGFTKRIRFTLRPASTTRFWQFGKSKLNDYMVNGTQTDPLQDLIHSEVWHSFRSTYTGLFQHINRIKQNISFIMRNQLPSIIPNQIYHTNRDVAGKLPSGEYWYSKTATKHR